MTDKEWGSFFARKCVFLIKTQDDYNMFVEEVLKRNSTLKWNGGRELNEFNPPVGVYPICVDIHRMKNTLMYDNTSYYKKEKRHIVEYKLGDGNEANNLLSWIGGVISGAL